MPELKSTVFPCEDTTEISVSLKKLFQIHFISVIKSLNLAEGTGRQSVLIVVYTHLISIFSY